MHKHEKNISYKGVGLGIAKKAMILVHGRGANPESILGLAPHLKVNDFALLARVPEFSHFQDCINLRACSALANL